MRRGRSASGNNGGMLPATARRLAAAAALAACVAAGLAVHALVPDGAVGDITGDALYAVAIYAGLVLLFAPVRPLVLAATAAAWCVGVELFQLTGVPLALAAAFRPAALVFGTGFDARDLAVYPAAIAVAWAIDTAIRRRVIRADLPDARAASSMGS